MTDTLIYPLSDRERNKILSRDGNEQINELMTIYGVTTEKELKQILCRSLNKYKNEVACQKNKITTLEYIINNIIDEKSFEKYRKHQIHQHEELKNSIDRKIKNYKKFRLDCYKLELKVKVLDILSDISATSLEQFRCYLEYEYLHDKERYDTRCEPIKVLHYKIFKLIVVASHFKAFKNKRV
jgi:hypothetical protein